MLGVQSLGPLMPRRVAECGGAPATFGAPTRPTAVPAPARSPAAAALDLAERERWAWVVLLSVSGLGPVSLGALLAAFGSARAVLDAATQADGPGQLLQALADAAFDADDGPDLGLFDTCAAAGNAKDAAAAGRGGPRARQVIGMDLAVRLCEAA